MEVTMLRILKIGMDVHSKSYTICVVEPKIGEEPELLHAEETGANYTAILEIITKLKKLYKNDQLDITCGYEAGCLGFTLQKQLASAGIKCIILAPSTMEVPGGKRIKTDKRDAWLIAKCLANGGYKAIHIPTEKDEDVRDYMRMREDAVELQKMIKQKTGAFCLRHGFKYDGNKWTDRHLRWLETLPLTTFQREVLNEYLIQFRYYADKIAFFDRRIEELASEEQYKDHVKKLRCFIGIETNTALSLLVEVGDFRRFSSAKEFSSYVGLVPGENSSSDNINRLPITKTGNKHVRKVLVEAAQCICRGQVGAKSKRLKAKQIGNDSNVLAYADRANERLRRKYYRMVFRGKHRNDAVAAVARELACFIWGMVTNHIA